jgi:hypothetical protein
MGNGLKKLCTVESYVECLKRPMNGIENKQSRRYKQTRATLDEHGGCVIAQLHSLLVECGRHDLTRRNEFLMDDAITVEEGDQHCLDIGLLQEWTVDVAAQ